MQEGSWLCRRGQGRSDSKGEGESKNTIEIKGRAEAHSPDMQEGSWLCVPIGLRLTALILDWALILDLTLTLRSLTLTGHCILGLNDDGQGYG